eukprot:5320521-Pleurochrysis_carterae.AAC.1
MAGAELAMGSGSYAWGSCGWIKLTAPSGPRPRRRPRAAGTSTPAAGTGTPRAEEGVLDSEGVHSRS